MVIEAMGMVIDIGADGMVIDCNAWWSIIVITLLLIGVYTIVKHVIESVTQMIHR